MKTFCYVMFSFPEIICDAIALMANEMCICGF